MALVKLCRENQVSEGSGQLFEAGGKQLAVFKAQGKLYCTDAICTHSGGPLQDGSVEDTCVTCPWHGAQFDIKTGKVISPPATEGIKTYEVKIENGIVMVDL
ncbi:non-heme iron oxygenase ferredoxin subunit [Candidatus Micrarchaeota archaeon]|nr:non-heme iron oxygenase ferredoxin subunit [Candidatus Micrarchaeota archaeon]